MGSAITAVLIVAAIVLGCALFGGLATGLVSVSWLAADLLGLMIGGIAALVAVAVAMLVAVIAIVASLLIAAVVALPFIALLALPLLLVILLLQALANSSAPTA